MGGRGEEVGERGREGREGSHITTRWHKQEELPYRKCTVVSLQFYIDSLHQAMKTLGSY